MATSYSLPAVTAALLADPTFDGTVQVADTSKFEVGCIVQVTSSSQLVGKTGQVASISSSSSMKLAKTDGSVLDVTAYKQSDGAVVTQLAQAVGAVQAADPALLSTVTSGVTVNNNAPTKRVVWKATILPAAWGVAAAATADVSLCTIPAKAKVVGVISDTTVAFAGLAGTIALKVGKTTGGNEYLISHDVKTAAVTAGLLDADMGAALAAATAVQGGDVPSWSAGTIVKARLTSGTGNIGTGSASLITAGTVVIYVIAEIFA